MGAIRWGVLATGRIAHNFVADLALVPDAEVVAVGSRRPDTAQDFATQHVIPHAHSSYAELAADPDVDVVYVASPHAHHHHDVLLCLEQGKHVLCEKALTLNARDAADLVSEARRRDVFFMEAMWMRCNPNIRRLQEVVGAGRIGRVGWVSASVGFRADPPPTHRLLDPALGASSLLDCGIYPLTLAWLLLGRPDAVQANGRLSERGIDLDCTALLEYAEATATVTSSMTTALPGTALVAGSHGWIELPSPFTRATGFVVHEPAAQPEQVALPLRGRGYVHEIEEVHACLTAGRTESRLVPLDETVAILEVADEIRRQIGCRLPGD